MDGEENIGRARIQSVGGAEYLVGIAKQKEIIVIFIT